MSCLWPCAVLDESHITRVDDPFWYRWNIQVPNWVFGVKAEDLSDVDGEYMF